MEANLYWGYSWGYYDFDLGVFSKLADLGGENVFN
jgi:hypothetical protein